MNARAFPRRRALIPRYRRWLLPILEVRYADLVIFTSNTLNIWQYIVSPIACAIRVYCALSLFPQACAMKKRYSYVSFATFFPVDEASTPPVAPETFTPSEGTIVCILYVFCMHFPVPRGDIPLIYLFICLFIMYLFIMYLFIS